MQIRHATPADTPQLRALLRDYVDWIGLDLAFQEVEAEIKGLPGDYAPPHGVLLVACPDGGQPVAMIALRPLAARAAEMKRLYVHPSARGQGLARTLIARLLDEARALGYQEIRLDTLPMMGDAQALYTALGFVDIRRTTTRRSPGRGSWPGGSDIAAGAIMELLTARHLRVLAMLVLATIMGAGRPTFAQPTSLTVLSRDGRKPLPVTTINNQDYVAVDDINTVFGTTAREDRLAGGLTITLRGRSIVLTADQNVVSVSGRLVSLPSPPLRRDNRWFVPADFLPRAMSLILDTRLDLRRAARLLIVGDVRAPRVVARVDAGSTNVAVTFEVTPNTDVRVTTQPGRLVVQFEADVLDLALPSLPPQTFLLGLTPGETPNSVVLTTGPRYAMHRVTTSQADAGSGRVTVDLLPATTTDTAAAPAAPAVVPDSRLVIPSQGPATGLRTVVIDPGHGGEELGTQGAKGTLEKDITLAVARRLRTLIESRLGAKVFLTREDDRTLSLDDRSAFANNHQADVFLSIHANSAVRPSLKGAEVYFLTIERADAEARKRAGDNATTLPELGGGTREIDLILWETAQARYLEQSAALAGFVEQALAGRIAMSPRAVQQAPFRVLVGANMPAALVEIGYLSNAEQESQLATGGYQDQVAQALLDALIKFREFLEH